MAYALMREFYMLRTSHNGAEIVAHASLPPKDIGGGVADVVFGVALANAAGQIWIQTAI